MNKVMYTCMCTYIRTCMHDDQYIYFVVFEQTLVTFKTELNKRLPRYVYVYIHNFGSAYVQKYSLYPISDNFHSGECTYRPFCFQLRLKSES